MRFFFVICRIGEIVQSRQSKIWLQPDFMFKCTQLYKSHQRCIEILHGFSYRVIRERKEEIAKAKLNNNDLTLPDHNGVVAAARDDEVVFGKKKRLAFLDLLIEASQNGTVLSNDDIREEVDTFMFEVYLFDERCSCAQHKRNYFQQGHDTTSAAISWTLFLLGSSPEIQEKVIQEIDYIMDGDRTRAPTMKELMDMKYLECVIKEALRLYPSVPLIARRIKEDISLGKKIILSVSVTTNTSIQWISSRRVHNSSWDHCYHCYISSSARCQRIPQSGTIQSG